FPPVLRVFTGNKSYKSRKRKTQSNRTAKSNNAGFKPLLPFGPSVTLCQFCILFSALAELLRQ
ncbi:MAG: hypothetical protein VB133_11830, partial [Anaeromusa sp.]|uniref:hypothetical protein n=1 Tax=Anaeromusa sp. TaxID=1872520 RepID=UPI002B1EBD34